MHNLINYFQHKEADPPIEAFYPTKIYTAESEVKISDLQKLVQDSHINDAVLVYGLLKNNNIDIPADLKHDFFELLCFYNHDEPLDEEWIEERWFKQSERIKERPRKTWKDGDMAEQLFNEIEPKEAKTYSCMIRGMCKFFQVERANAIFSECIANNINLDVEAYNGMLGIVSNLKESADLRWNLIKDILLLMKEKKVDPNLGTMNAALYTINQMGTREARDYALTILAEFKKIGIEPSLGSYAFIIQIFCRDRNQVSHVLFDIMNEIEGKEFEIRDKRDTNFFIIAMDACRHHLFNPDLAKRVNNLLHHGENYNLIGDSYKESNYYRNYFSLLAQTESLETFMNDYYHQLVPHVYIPEPAVMEEILTSIESNDAFEHMLLIWSHMIQFEQITRENLLNLVVRIMINAKSAEKYNEDFAKIAWDVWTKLEEKNESRSKPIVWTGKMLGDLMRLTCRIQDMEKASVLLNKLFDYNKILGEPDFEALEEFVDLSIIKKQPSKALQCLQLCTELNHPDARTLAKKMCKEFTLDESHMNKISYYLGSDLANEIFKEAEKEREEQLKNIKSN